MWGAGEHPCVLYHALAWVCLLSVPSFSLVRDCGNSSIIPVVTYDCYNMAAP